MQVMGRLIVVLLLIWSSQASALPGEENFSVQSSSSKEQTKVRKGLILKMLAGLLNGLDVDREAFSDFDHPLERKLEEEPAMLGPPSRITQRDRKAPCKNFFWKTFTAC